MWNDLNEIMTTLIITKMILVKSVFTIKWETAKITR